MLCWRVEVADLEHAVLSRAADDRFEIGQLEWEDGRHGTSGPGVVCDAACIDQPQRVCEVERADMDQVVVFTQAHAKRSLGGYANALQAPQMQMVRQKDADLDVTVRGKDIRVIRAIVGQQ